MASLVERANIKKAKTLNEVVAEHTNLEPVLPEAVGPGGRHDPGGFVEVKRDPRSVVDANPPHRQDLERVLVRLDEDVLK